MGREGREGKGDGHSRAVGSGSSWLSLSPVGPVWSALNIWVDIPVHVRRSIDLEERAGYFYWGEENGNVRYFT